VELGVVLHEGDAFALDGVGHNAGGPALGGLGFPQRLLNGGEIVAIDLDGVPAEGAPLIGHGRDSHDVLHEAIELDAVVIHDGNYVIDLMEGAGHGGFPDLAFLDFAVAEHDISAAGAAVEARAQSHSKGQREAFAQRAGGGLQAGNEAHVGMPLVDGAEFAQGIQLADGGVGETGFRHDGIEHGRGVALGEDETVAIGPLGVLRVDAHVVEVELDHDFDGRERSSGVPRLGGAGHLDNLAANTFTDGLKFFYGFGH
jgi:hypothetical protein